MRCGELAAGGRTAARPLSARRDPPHLERPGLAPLARQRRLPARAIPPGGREPADAPAGRGGRPTVMPRRSRRHAAEDVAVDVPAAATASGWLLLSSVRRPLLVLRHRLPARRSRPAASARAGPWRRCRSLPDPAYPAILWRTLWISSVTTALCLVLALPVAYLARSQPEGAADPAAAGDHAVLDQFPDPRLRLEAGPAPRRAAQQASWSPCACSAETIAALQPRRGAAGQRLHLSALRDPAALRRRGEVRLPAAGRRAATSARARLRAFAACSCPASAAACLPPC